MGIQAIYPKPNLSKPDKQHKIYPYLLTGVKINRPNQVWGADISYIKINGSWAYLVAIMDWFSRFVVSWELSGSLEADFCIVALENGLQTAIPEIHNSDQGSQFTANEYLAVLESIPQIRISMDSRGRVFDNIFNERLWRTVKYEEVYLKEYYSLAEARESLRGYFKFYNNKRFHQSLGYKTPAKVYFAKQKSAKSGGVRRYLKKLFSWS